MAWARRASVWGVAAMLVGCATPPPPAAPESAAAAPVAEMPAADKYDFTSRPLKHLANRKLEPIPDRPLNVKTSCSFRDPTGYRGRLDLQVKNDDVRRFRAEVKIPKHGDCSFDLKDFRQSAQRPVALANAAGAECVVQMWEQKEHVTVAFRNCQAQCSGESFDYLWPILVDARSGKCS